MAVLCVNKLVTTLSSFCLKHSEKELFNSIYREFIVDQFKPSDSYRFANFFHIIYESLKKIKIKEFHQDKILYLKESNLFIKDLKDESLIPFVNFSYKDLFSFSCESTLDDLELHYIIYVITTYYA